SCDHPAARTGAHHCGRLRDAATPSTRTGSAFREKQVIRSNTATTRRHAGPQEVIRDQNALTPSMKVLERGECAAPLSPSNVASNCSISSRWRLVRLIGVSTT